MTSNSPLLDRLREGVLLADGAMGTLLHARGNLPIDACFEALNIDDPDLVAGIHREYVEAGADLIETNTFGANRYKLAEHGLADKVTEINRAAVELARWAVARKGGIVVGAVGPLGIRMEPFGKLSREDAANAFTEQLSALAEAGVDAFQFETFTDHGELLEAIAVARAVAPDLPIIAQMTFNGDDRTLLGYLPGRVADELQRAGADVIGVNCSGGPTQITRIVEMMRRSVPDATYSAVPNAGFPESVGGRIHYHASADYFADAALNMRDAGASLVGGCCGTTPAHIAAMRAALDNPTAAPRTGLEVTERETVETSDDTIKQPTELAYRLANGQFTVTVELTPPRSFDTAKLIRSGELLRDAGAHLLDIADSPAAKMRMSPWAACQVLQSEVGLETILHFPTRGRNLLRIQGDLLASHALGLRNLFVTMGDPTKIGDYPEAMDAFDIAPSALIGVISQQMNKGTDVGGNSIGGATSFTVGCALNMFADDLDRELRVLGKKLDNGADFALGQTVFRPELIERFHVAYEERFGEPFKLPVIMGIIPLYSLKQALYLHHEVPGINIPDAILKRIEDAGDDAPAEGVKIAQELLRAVQDKVQGAYIIPSLGRYHLAAEVIDAVRVPS